LKLCTLGLQLGTKTAFYLLTCRFTIGIIVEANSIHLWGFVKNWRLLPIKQHSMTLCNLFNALFWGKWRLSKFNFPCSKLLRDLGKLALVCGDDGLQLTIRFLGFNAYWESIMLVKSFDSLLEVQPLSSWMPSSHQLKWSTKMTYKLWITSQPYLSNPFALWILISLYKEWECDLQMQPKTYAVYNTHFFRDIQNWLVHNNCCCYVVCLLVS
jgi:hypothetical protein